MGRFLITVIIVSAVLLGFSMLAVSRDWISQPSYLYEILAFSAVTAVILFAFIYRIRNPGIFIQLYLLTMVVKMLGSGIFIFIVTLNDRPGAASNVAFFLLSYIIFTGLEVGFLYHEKARNNSV